MWRVFASLLSEVHFLCGDPNHLFMISTHATMSMPSGNNKLSKQAINLTYFIIWLQVQVYTFKYDLNIGRNIYRAIIIHLRVQ